MFTLRLISVARVVIPLPIPQSTPPRQVLGKLMYVPSTELGIRFRIICVKGFTLIISKRVEVVLNVVSDYLKSGLSASNLLH